jgi:hypothetical protein
MSELKGVRGVKRRALNEVKRSQAEKRNTRWANLSFEDQLKELNDRPGNSKRQRERISQNILKRDEAEKRTHQLEAKKNNSNKKGK